MPLPDPGTPWPPPPLAQAHADVGRWSAWWGGDPDELSRVYGGWVGTAGRSFSERGGMVGALQRWFWGTPPRAGERRAKLHIPLPAEIAQTSADLLFGQPPLIVLADAEQPVKDRVAVLLGERTATQLHEAAEAAAALGHTWLRVGWDRDIVPDAPLLSVVDADAAYPVHRWGHLVEVTFAREWDHDGAVLRHLECHEPGMIWHAAYLGDRQSLGRLVPLDAHPETTGINVEGMVADDRRHGSGVPTGIDRLTVIGVANARSRTWRHLPAARDLGRADVAGLEPVLDALDDTMSSWMRDIRHGRSRIHVPAHMLHNHGPGRGATADLDREVYVGLESPPDGPMQLTATQFKIRHEEHRATAAALVERIVSGAGYSPQTFGLDSDTSLTATEAWARQVRTQHTRDGKLRRWRPALGDLTRLLLEVDRAQFGGPGDPGGPVEVRFPDTVAESQLARAQTAAALRAADAASTRTLVEMVHKDWDDAAVNAEVARILADQGGIPASAVAGLDVPADA